jgi:hypothetical protein
MTAHPLRHGPALNLTGAPTDPFHDERRSM